MVSRHGRSSESMIDLKNLKNDINGIQYFLKIFQDEREQLTSNIVDELEQIYMNKVKLLREGNLVDVTKVISIEMTSYSALGMISKTMEMIELLEKFNQLDVDTQRLLQLEYEFITNTKNRTIITEVDDEI